MEKKKKKIKYKKTGKQADKVKFLLKKNLSSAVVKSY